jgi:hypothetical protein
MRLLRVHMCRGMHHITTAFKFVLIVSFAAVKETQGEVLFQNAFFYVMSPYDMIGQFCGHAFCGASIYCIHLLHAGIVCTYIVRRGREWRKSIPNREHISSILWQREFHGEICDKCGNVGKSKKSLSHK